MNYITLSIFVLGTTTVILSAIVAILFWGYGKKGHGHTKRLSKSLSNQLVGEAVLGLGTLFFAAAAHYGVLTDMSSTVQSAIRFVMFLATSATTIHLWITVKKIQ